jgi:hypothetical protein
LRQNKIGLWRQLHIGLWRQLHIWLCCSNHAEVAQAITRGVGTMYNNVPAGLQDVNLLIMLYSIQLGGLKGKELHQVTQLLCPGLSLNDKPVTAQSLLLCCTTCY